MSDKTLSMERYIAGQKALDKAIEKIKRLEAENAWLAAEKKQWQLEKVMQIQVIQQEIERLNRVAQEQAEEINRLRALLPKDD